MTATSAIPTQGLRHVALNVAYIPAAVAFCSSVFGMEVVWQPDPETVSLSSGCDNLALHRSLVPTHLDSQHLAHLGFIAARPEEVDRAANVLAARHPLLLQPPRPHRDGSRSRYCADPDGNAVQIRYEPTLSAQRLT